MWRRAEFSNLSTKCESDQASIFDISQLSHSIKMWDCQFVGGSNGPGFNLMPFYQRENSLMTLTAIWSLIVIALNLQQISL